ncbi:hypothetical protein [Paraliomyxa miuraensis]|uniref:hypothetical protein n=1 Tax=Paraliomyxa miuraensis TaxID=376150 RepID=UPI002254B394|nr:hypothetical protein [Paraliomyxa miuraensis]MCX4247703.1 hypothetical protein [Paraliomyxa miuraensis]
MMTRREQLLPLVVALVSVIACKREPEPAAATPLAAASESVTPSVENGSAGAEPEAEAEVLEVMQALGDQGAAVVVVRPRHWASLHDVLVPWSTTLPREASMLADLLQERTGLRRYVARWLDATPVELEGWDEARSVVISYGEVPYGGPPGMATPSMSTAAGRLLPVRHQVWMPASDPAALVASLDRMLAGQGAPFPLLVEGRAGAKALRGDAVTVAILPLEKAVRVVVFQGAFGVDEALLLEHMRSHLDASPAVAAPTPARALLVRPDAVVSALVRPWRMRPLAAWTGSVEILDAVATVSPDWREGAISRGLQIVLDAELLMTDEGAELDDSAQSLVVDDGVLRLRSAMSLTPEGEGILAAASRGAGRVLAAPVDDAWVDVAVQADVRAMLEATAAPPGFEAAEAAGELARAVQEGGYFATLYMALRHPFGALRVAEQLARRERLPVPIDVLPNSARVVWRGLGEQGPRVVVALGWAGDYVDRPLAGMVPVIKGEPGFESLRMDSIRRDGHPVTVFGLGGESASSLDAEEGSAVPGLVRARVSLARIGADLATRDPERAAWLTGAGEVTMTFEHRDRALLGELAWAPGKAAIQAKPVPRLEHEDWSSPVGMPVGDGARCLARAGRAVATGLGASVTVDPEHESAVLGRALAEAEEPLRCAEGHEATAEAAKGLRRMLGGTHR